MKADDSFKLKVSSSTNRDNIKLGRIIDSSVLTEVVKILKENNVDYEFIEKLYDGCNVFQIYAEDDVPAEALSSGERYGLFCEVAEEV